MPPCQQHSYLWWQQKSLTCSYGAGHLPGQHRALSDHSCWHPVQGHSKMAQAPPPPVPPSGLPQASLSASNNRGSDSLGALAPLPWGLLLPQWSH